MKPSKQTPAKHNRGKTSNIHTLHHRLYQALNLGTRFVDRTKCKWQWTDIEAQRCVIRSIASFLDCISGDTSSLPLVKDSVADIVGALVWILEHKSEAVLRISANVVVKLISVIPKSVLQAYMLDLVHPLSSLLSSRQFEVSMSCCAALNMILLNLSVKSENKVWEILDGRKTVSQIVNCIQDSFSGNISIEYFQEMASLLSTILRKWPPSRYLVWNDAKLLEVLEFICAEHDLSDKVVILKLYSGIALCGNGAMKLLQKSGEAFLQTMVICMSRSQPLSIRMEGFKLAQCLVTNEQGCSKVMSICGEPFVKAIIDGMSAWTLCSGRIANDQLSFLALACRLALIVRWEGDHHDYFWKNGIDEVLLNLLLEKYDDGSSQYFSSLEEQIPKALEGFKASFLFSLRSYIWDILGWLATHCSEDFNPGMHDREPCINVLIKCACLSFMESIRKGHQVYVVADGFRSESVSRAVIMMIYSRCKYIALKSRYVLFEILKPTDKEHVKRLLYIQNVTASHKDIMGLPDVLQIIVNLEVLTCYAGLPQFQSHMIENGGIKILIGVIRWCLRNSSCSEGLSFSPHFRNTEIERTCCWICKEWEGDDKFLLYALWGLAELLHSGYAIHNDIFADMTDHSEALFVSTLQEICSGASAPGLKWYAAYVLCYFGFYGSPSKLGRHIGEVLNDNESADMQLILANGDSVNVHCIVLAVRCPSLLPPEDMDLDEKGPNGSTVRYDSEKQYKMSKKEIRLSSHVDNRALIKLLEFIYTGYLCAGELTKELKILAKRCGLQHLLIMLCRRRPKWGTAFPIYDLTTALTTARHHFSDITLEAKESETMQRTCRACSSSLPHIHAHKVVLRSRSNYFRAMFQSGMQESHLGIIKLPVSWEAMVKLVNWIYTDDLPNPLSGCLWDNMDTGERVKSLQPYLELCWLSELWLLEDVHDICYKAIVSCLDSDRYLSIEIIKIAVGFSLWRLAEVAASYLAPLYRRLCHSGDLETLDEGLVDMIRAASVQLSQEESVNHLS